MSACDVCKRSSPTLHSCDGGKTQECLDCHDRLYKDVIISLASLLHGKTDIYDLPPVDLAAFLAKMGPPSRCDYAQVLTVVERAFDMWVEELVEHQGSLQVKDALGSTAIQSMFHADVGQRVWALRRS